LDVFIIKTQRFCFKMYKGAGGQSWPQVIDIHLDYCDHFLRTRK
jgi:hypothetical protein